MSIDTSLSILVSMNLTCAAAFLALLVSVPMVSGSRFDAPKADEQHISQLLGEFEEVKDPSAPLTSDELESSMSEFEVLPTDLERSTIVPRNDGNREQQGRLIQDYLANNEGDMEKSIYLVVKKKGDEMYVKDLRKRSGHN